MVPEFFLAHVDKYGQIVPEFDSKVTIQIDSYKKDAKTKAYVPLLSGTTQYISYGGVVAVDNLQFSGAPGYNYSLLFLSSGINENLPANEEFLEAVSAP